METILCPQCGTETDASKSQCGYCGKIILAEKQIQTPKKLEPSFPGDKKTRDLAKSLNSLDDDDLFGELEPFSLNDEDSNDDDQTKDLPSSAGTDEPEDDKKDETGPKKPRKFENPAKKSSLMKKLQEDQDLFGSLDD